MAAFLCNESWLEAAEDIGEGVECELSSIEVLEDENEKYVNIGIGILLKTMLDDNHNNDELNMKDNYKVHVEYSAQVQYV